MAGFRVTQYPSFGLGSFSLTGKSKPIPVIFFDEFEAGENAGNFLQLKAANNSLLSSIPLVCENTILQSLTFETDVVQGNGKFELVFNKQPDIPILPRTVLQLRLGNQYLFTGEVSDYPVEGDYKSGSYIYSGSGFSDRLKKMKIDNKYKYNVQSIVKSGVNITINTDTSIDVSGLGGNLVGLYAILKDSDENKNNGTFVIISYTSSSITVNKANGVSTTNPIGVLSILPPTWSNSVLVSDLVKYVLQEYTPLDSPIKYDNARIEETTGILTLGATDWDGFKFEDFFKKIRTVLDGGLSNVWRFYIDEEGFYALKKTDTSTLKDKYFVGYQILGKPEIKRDSSQIANSVVVLRNKAREAQGNGFRQAGFAEDETSIAKIGLEEYEEQVPGYFSNALGQAYAEAILESRKEAKLTTKVSDLPFKKYEFGNYGYVTSLDYYTDTINECDSLDDWTAGVNISASLDSTDLVDGTNSIRLTYDDSAEGQTFLWTPPVPKILNNPKLIYFYLRGNATGKYIKFGIGETSYSEHLFNVAVEILNTFSLIAIDISGLGLTKVGQLGFQFYGLENGYTYVNRIDFIQVRQYTSKHYEFPLKKAKYELMSHYNSVELEFGAPFANPNLGEFLSGVKGQIETTKLNLKE